MDKDSYEDDINRKLAFRIAPRRASEGLAVIRALVGEALSVDRKICAAANRWIAGMLSRFELGRRYALALRDAEILVEKALARGLDMNA
jgi:hypothetical protein